MAVSTVHGARRVLALPVSGAFHSPLMDHARAGLAEALESLPIATPSCPVYLNVSAEPTTDPEVIRAALLDQLTSPVRWSQTLTNMQRDGFDSFLEVGAGKVLTGLAKRTLGREVETQINTEKTRQKIKTIEKSFAARISAPVQFFRRS